MSIVKLGQHKLLLDTHVWIWLMNGDPSLSTSFLNAIVANQEKQGILVSAISVWEFGMLVEKKRISIEIDALDWIDKALEGINLISISPKIAIQSTRLPGAIHGDPADRILIATAFEEKAILITCDEKLLAYGRERFISVFDPR